MLSGDAGSYSLKRGVFKILLIICALRGKPFILFAMKFVQ